VPASQSHDLVLRNEAAELTRLNTFVSEFCSRESLPDGFEMALMLAAEEAFINVVRYAFSDAQPHPIVVRLQRDGEGVRLEVDDDGAPFNPLETPQFDPATPLEQRRAGGLGIHLLRNLMTELRYERVNGRNRLILRKLRP
jgi:anti-sigma regulatory factor (Ser/Thr protein kinase)